MMQSEWCDDVAFMAFENWKEVSVLSNNETGHSLTMVDYYCWLQLKCVEKMQTLASIETSSLDQVQNRTRADAFDRIPNTALSLRAIWILDEQRSNIIFSRRFPTVERRALGQYQNDEMGTDFDDINSKSNRWIVRSIRTNFTFIGFDSRF